MQCSVYPARLARWGMYHGVVISASMGHGFKIINA